MKIYIGNYLLVKFVLKIINIYNIMYIIYIFTILTAIFHNRKLLICEIVKSQSSLDSKLPICEIIKPKDYVQYIENIARLSHFCTQKSQLFLDSKLLIYKTIKPIWIYFNYGNIDSNQSQLAMTTNCNHWFRYNRILHDDKVSRSVLTIMRTHSWWSILSGGFH